MSADSSKQKIKVIDSLWTFAIALAFLGPFAIPLLWRNPRFSVRVKTWGSVIIVLFTLFLIWGSAEMVNQAANILSQQ